MIFCRRASRVGRCSAAVWAAWRMLPAVIAAVLWTAACQPPKIVGLSSLMVDKIYRLTSQDYATYEAAAAANRLEGRGAPLDKVESLVRSKHAYRSHLGGRGLNALQLYADLLHFGFKHQRGKKKVTVIGCVGEDKEGAMIKNKMTAADMNLALLRTVQSPATGHYFTLLGPESSARMTVVGANASPAVENREELTQKLDELLQEEPPRTEFPKHFRKRNEEVSDPPSRPIVFVDGHGYSRVPKDLKSRRPRDGSIENPLELVEALADFAANHELPFVMSLLPDYLVQKHHYFVKGVLEKTSIVFGNLNGLRRLVGHTPRDKFGRTAKAVLDLMKIDLGIPKMVVVPFQGDEGTARVAFQFGRSKKVASLRHIVLPKESVISNLESNEAAFIGGFLFGLLKDGRALIQERMVRPAVERALVYGVRAVEAVKTREDFSYKVSDIDGNVKDLKKQKMYTVKIDGLG